jgi:hypothetical protein
VVDQLFKSNLTFCAVCVFNLQFEKSVLLRRVIHSQSTLQRQLRRQILKNTLYVYVMELKGTFLAQSFFIYQLFIS